MGVIQPDKSIKRISEDNDMLDLVGLIVFLLIPGGIGIMIFIMGWLDRVRGERSINWPYVEGTIIKSDFRRGKEGPEFNIEYHYQVEGLDYKSNRIRFGKTPANSFVAETYSYYSTHPVYYDPEKPKIATLEQGPNNDANMYMFIYAPIAFIIHAWIYSLILPFLF